MYLAWWNSLDVISILSTASRFAVPVLGLLVVVFGFQESKLRARAQETQRQKTEAAIDDARTRARNAEERLTPRSVSQSQRAKFIEAVKNVPKGKLSVYSFMSADPGTIQYANQVRDMVVAAGFDSGIMVGMSIGGGQIPVGAAIAVKDAKSQPAFAGDVQRAFAEAGIPLGGMIDATVPTDEVKIVIGLKPE